MLADLAGIFPEVDRAVHGDLNAIATAVKDWRKDQLRAFHDEPTPRGNLH